MYRRLSALLCLALAAALFPAQAFGQAVDPSAFGGLHWRSIGPFRGGRTVAITGVPKQQNIFYMAPTDGGVWKTDDYGRTWTPIFDGQPTQSIGALAVAQSDPQTIYAGSGEGLLRPDLSTGDGIYKSRDGGKSWQHLGLRDAQQIGAIVVDPKDANRLFVAVLGHPYGPSSERGVFRSLDGGATFQKVLYTNPDTGAASIAMDPSNPQVLYASMWAARHSAWFSDVFEHQDLSGMYKSVDGGSTWKKLAVGLPALIGRIGFGISRSNSNVVYAQVDAKAAALYRSADAGATWTVANNEDRITGRGQDFAHVSVDPADENIVYIANTSTYRSTNGGKTFTAIKGAPGGDDYHTVWINPENTQIIALAVDQGATISVNGGKTWSSWYNQPTAQFFHVITDNQFPYWVYGAQQESGSAGTPSRSNYGEISFREWHPVGTEEYGYVAPDPLHPNIIYGGKVQRYDSKTGEVQEVGPVLNWRGNKTYRFNRTAPLLFSPTDPHTLYLGSSVLFRTRNGGQRWDIISPDLTRKIAAVTPNLTIFAQTAAKHARRGVIYSLAPSPLQGAVIWAGTDDGLIWRTADGGRIWRNISPPGLTSWSKVAQLDASHFDVQTAYAAVNRFRLDDLHPYVYRTHDAGKHWDLIANGLPQDAAVNVVREDPTQRGLLFAGTEHAIYVSFDDGNHWQSLQLNLPATSMRDLVIHQDDIVVGTHGRSFWILDNITPLRQLARAQSVNARLFRPALAYRIRWNQNTDTPLPPEEPAGQNPPDGAMIDYFLPAAAAGPVIIEVRDGHGTLVRRYASTDQPERVDPGVDKPAYWIRPTQIPSANAGMHRLVWDLRYPAPDVLEHDYPISAIFADTPRVPRGPIAVPGTYTVVLTAGGHSYRQPLTIKMDPRIAMSQAQLQAQFAVAQQLAAALRGVAARLKSPKDTATKEALQGLQGRLAQLLDLVESADAPPTAQALRAVHQALGELAHTGD
ncbi:MAG: glycoside hydrolase [Candidatus Eremiobacteraeota bacterium]|nr:glycoside hydrolase [Candidatus Eremiobacteraeota bacterium]